MPDRCNVKCTQHRETLYYTKQLVQLLDPNVPNGLSEGLGRILICHADHEIKRFTAAIRRLTSSGAEVFFALWSRVTAL